MIRRLDCRMDSGGSVHFSLGGQPVLTAGWGVDRGALRPSGVRVSGAEARFTAEEGELVTRVGYGPEGTAALSCTANLSEKPQFLFPVFRAAVHGLRGAFRQGFGLGGPSGWLSPEELRENRIVFSYQMTVLRFDAGYVCVFCRDGRRYIQRSELFADPVREGVYAFSGEEEVFRFSAGFLTECTASAAELPALEFVGGDSLDELLDFAAQAVAGEYDPPVPAEPAYHWCSWYYYYNNFSYDQLRDVLEGLRNMENPPALRCIQIDAGYFTSAGDWLEPNGLWPGGLEAAFSLIRSYGYRPGIWIAPFMVGSRSRLFAEHPDWILRERSGEPVKEWQMYNEPKVWGYQDEEYYVLDVTRPEALAYLRHVFRTLRAWGAEFFKTDFMLWGIQDGARVLRFDPEKTTVEAYRALMTGIREEIGDAYWLGCIAPYLPSIGFVNAMRIAGDVGASWGEEGFGPVEMIRQASGDSHLNGRFWQNDPDALILRDFHVFLSEREAVSLALFQAASGGAVYTSDPLHRIAPKRLALFRFVRPPQSIVRPYFPWRESGRAVVLLLHDLGEGRRMLFLLNPTRAEQDVVVDFHELPGGGEWFLTGWEDGWKTDGQRHGGWAGRIPPHGCKLLYAGQTEPVRDVKNLWLQD